ncbi:MAG: hypothetical protein KatS3mg114_0558 [Planctomycetaceae bacterium]|nr:MAG: hypothetical protein KatS3mg114_0558 [Planctomycetaceae bacterium]
MDRITAHGKRLTILGLGGVMALLTVSQIYAQGYLYTPVGALGCAQGHCPTPLHTARYLPSTGWPPSTSCRNGQCPTTSRTTNCPGGICPRVGSQPPMITTPQKPLNPGYVSPVPRATTSPWYSVQRPAYGPLPERSTSRPPVSGTSRHGESPFYP